MREPPRACLLGGISAVALCLSVATYPTTPITISAAAMPTVVFATVPPEADSIPDSSWTPKAAPSVLFGYAPAWPVASASWRLTLSLDF